MNDPNNGQSTQNLTPEMQSILSRLENLESHASAVETDFDAIRGRLDAAEKTIAAIGDHVRNGGVGAIDEIRDALNSFHRRLFQDDLIPPATSPE